MNVGRKLFILLQTLFLGSEIRKGLKDHTKIRKVLKGVHNNWSYHCLYFQTPGQLEDFFKLESYLLDISTKSIVLPEKSIYWDILIPNSRSGNKTFVHCSSRYQAGHVITIFLYLLLKFILGNSYSSYKSSAKTYIGNISIINT